MGAEFDGHIDALLDALRSPALTQGVLEDLSQSMLAAARADHDTDPELAMQELAVALVALNGLTVHQVAAPYEDRYAQLTERVAAFERLSAERYADALPQLLERLDRLEGKQ